MRNVINEKRYLQWDACYNTRDLGGLPTSHDRQTALGFVVRSDVLRRLTTVGLQQALDYGVNAVIDLRAREQVAEDPYDLALLADSQPAPAYFNLPFIDFSQVDHAIFEAAQDLTEEYCLMLDHCRPQVGAIVQRIAMNTSGTTVIHCSAGKDRAGLITVLLLALAGVPSEVIAADYAESEARLWPLYHKLVAAAGDDPVKVAKLPPPPTSPPARVHAVLAHLAATYGDVEAYLLQCGVKPETIEDLRMRLLGSVEC